MSNCVRSLKGAFVWIRMFNDASDDEFALGRERMGTGAQMALTLHLLKCARKGSKNHVSLHHFLSSSPLPPFFLFLLSLSL